MASAGLREELSCPICLDLYTEPVSLGCGHNFCRSCIVAVLDTQQGSGVYFCPECRKEYPERPQLEKSRKLSNIVEHVESTDPKQEKVLCTFCDVPAAATKTCLQCETSFCKKHLENHNKSVDHVLSDPTSSFRDRKCSVHKEVLKYYCPADGVCICMSCRVAGDHKGHQVELLDEAAEKKRETLRDATKKLDSQRQETERRIQNLERHSRAEKGKAAEVTERAAGLFRDIRRHLVEAEKIVQAEISRQEETMSQSASDLTQQLERQKDELSGRMKQMEELCDIKDPLTVLMKELCSDDIIHKSGDITSDVRDVGCLDERMILEILHSGLPHFTDSLIEMKIKRQFRVMEKSDMSLDLNTASPNIIISEDLLSASYTDTDQKRPEGLERFRSKQVLSTQIFSSGRHYWEVDVSGAKNWLIGVAAHSIERKIEGKESFIGYNDKSWSLSFVNYLSALHNDIKKKINSLMLSLRTVGIYLDYEGGRLSFYHMSDPIRHLHTFTATFTEPLHAALYVSTNTSIRIIQ